MPHGLKVESIDEPAGLHAIQPEWWALWRRCSAATPFQSPAWLVPWILEFAPETFMLLTGRIDGRLVGLLALDTLDEGSRRQAVSCGGTITDYQDGLFEPARAEAVADRMLAALRAEPLNFRKLRLARLRADSVLLTLPVEEVWIEQDRQQSAACPLLTLPPDGGDLSQSVPKKMMQELRYYRRRAEKLGTLSFTLADAGQSVRFFDKVAALHGARWARRDRTGVLADEAVRRFHHAAVPWLAEAGLARVYLMASGAREAAGLYGLVRNGRFHYYIGGFDPDLKHLAAGTLIIGHAIGEAVREGQTGFDFLSGQEPYKYKWGARDVPLFERTLVAA